MIRVFYVVALCSIVCTSNATNLPTAEANFQLAAIKSAPEKEDELGFLLGLMRERKVFLDRAKKFRDEKLFGAEEEALLQALRASVSLFGRNHKSTAFVDLALGHNQIQLSNNREARKYLIRALDVYEALQIDYGSEAAKELLKRLDSIENYHDVKDHAIDLVKKRQYRDAEKVLRDAIELADEAFGSNSFHSGLARLLLGNNLYKLGEPEEALKHLGESIEIFYDLGQIDWFVNSLRKIGDILRDQERLRDYEIVLIASVEKLKEKYDEVSIPVIRMVALLAEFRYSSGEYAQSLAAYKRCESWLETLNVETELVAQEIYSGIGNVLEAAGGYPQSYLYRSKAFKISEKFLGRNHKRTLEIMSDLATSLLLSGRAKEAEVLYREVLTEIRAVDGEAGNKAAEAYKNIAIALESQQLHAEAITFFRKAVDASSKAGNAVYEAAYRRWLVRRLKERSELRAATNELVKTIDDWALLFGRASRPVFETKIDLAILYLRVSMHQQAEATLDEIIDLAQTLPSSKRRNYAAVAHLLKASLFRQSRRFAEADVAVEKAKLDIAACKDGQRSVNCLPPSSLFETFAKFDLHSDLLVSLARSYSGVARIWSNTKQFSIGGRQVSIEGVSNDNPPQFQSMHKNLLLATWLHAQSLADESADAEPSTETIPGLRNEGFGAAQDLIAGTTAKAVAQMAARFARGDDALARRVREQQDVANELGALDREVIKAWGENNRVKAENLNQRSTELAERLAELNRELEQQFPEYVQLASPVALDAADVQRLLRANEALVLIVPWGEHTYLFGLNQDHVVWQRVEVTAADIEARVTRLRCELDAATCAEPSGGVPDTRAANSAYSESIQQGHASFDRATASSLYQDLLAPLEPVLSDASHLYIVTRGALTSLPFSVLVTEPPQAGEDNADPEVLAHTAWLGERYALTHLPSVASLKSLRRFSSEPKTPLVGFGDPVLSGKDGADRGVQLDSYFRGVSEMGTVLADPAQLSVRLAPLPGTRVELEAMAEALDAPRSALHLGAQATEAVLKRTPLDTQVLTIATHGLLAVELKGLGEPGLVFTPPKAASFEDDGILTASEAAQLQLNVDWLVLSACNTAAADGTPGADGLSGLARAFLYAGAKRLLVSHWRVRDDATAQLTVATIKAGQRQSPAEALRSAMRQIRTGRDRSDTPIPGWQPGWAHPSVWAPFTLISAGGQ